MITAKATNKYGNTTTAHFRLLTTFASREPAKKALENFEKQPDYIKNTIPANLLTEVKRTTTQPLGITNDDVKNAADSLNNKIAEIVALENERKTDVSNAINELKKVIEYIADFKDVMNENDKILDPVAKQANLKELEKIAERYNKNTKKLEQTLDKIANLKNLNNFSKETLAQLQEVVNAASKLNTSSQLKTAEAIKNSTEDLASESEILEAINELESALNGLRADKTALNSQIKDFEDSQKWLKDEVKAEEDKAKEEYVRWEKLTKQDAESYPALELFNGLMYRNIARQNFNKEDREYISNYVFITSALYGVVNAYYPISEHRLDFLQKCKIGDESLKNFWREDYNKAIENDDFVISLLSSEFEEVFSPASRDKFIKINFMEV